MRKGFILIFFLLTVAQLYSQKFVNEFLNIGAGARSHGMAGAVISSTEDGMAALINPAGLTNISSSLQVNAMHAEWFAGVANYDYGSIAKRLNEEKKAYGSLSIVRFGIDNIPYTLNLIGPDGSVNYDELSSFSAVDYGMFLSYGQSIFNDNLRVGGSVKIINRSIGQFANAWGFGADIGLIYNTSRLSYGLMLKDITTTYNSWTFNFTNEEKAIFASTNNDIPISSTEIAYPRIILGVAFHSNKVDYTKPIQYNLELMVKFSTNSRLSGIGTENIAVDPAIGLEVGYKNLVFIRAGLGNVERSLNEFNGPSTLSLEPNIGLGLKMGRFGLDYALTNIGELGQDDGAFYSHIFSLRLDFEPK